MSKLRKIVNSDWNRGFIENHKCVVFVNNINSSVTAERLRALFNNCGKIVNIKLVGRDPVKAIKEQKGKWRTNYAFVTFETEEEANNCQTNFNNFILEELNLDIKIKKSDEEMKKEREERQLQREIKHQLYLERKERREQRELEHQQYLERKERRERREIETQKYLERQKRREEKEEEHKKYLERQKRREEMENRNEEKDMRPRKIPTSVRQEGDFYFYTYNYEGDEDWNCPKCGTYNFSTREKCLKKACEGVKPKK